MVHGGRIELKLSRNEAAAVYQVKLETSPANWQGSAEIRLDGTVELGEFRQPEPSSDASTPPVWLVDSLRRLLRALWRAHAASGSEKWPRRVHRWRAAPEGPSSC
ncbi:MAG TPA: hypothetical protein VGJ84_24320 [Polyangiaceae bacterium]